VDNDYLVTKQFIKVKFNDFTSTTVERQLTKGLPQESFEVLLEQAWERSGLPVRLLGLGVRFVDTRQQELVLQLDFFE
jgi:DNA polymerase-4